jgi:diketogulonate reductase-like aldo/keto reductase
VIQGDWKEEEVVQAVKDAISVGYRALDVAAIYGTEPAVGKGIKAKIADGTVKREDIFITTKVLCVAAAWPPPACHGVQGG